MDKFFVWLINPPTDGPKSTLLLRLMAGGVFFWEGLLKFVYVNQGVGRFTKLAYRFRTSRRPLSGTSRSLEGCYCLPA
jgi:putative oxidoreductase